MKLVHSNNSGQDLEFLRDYDFDLAYGESENNFTLTLSLANHCCSADDIVYMIDESLKGEAPTEYGGIIDAIKVNTERQTVTYSGRTWHGILAKKILEPDAGQDYYVVSGNAHLILAEILYRLDLEDLFTVGRGLSPIDIVRYQFPRYVDAYKCIRDMLAAFGGKLKLVYDGSHVVLTAVWLTDYSMDDEWDSTQVSFQAENSINNINHLICLGSGDLKERRVIHLFTDENGGIQPYATTDKPIQDSDYILDESSKKISGAEELTEVFDYSSASDKDNYVVLASQPNNWETDFMEYYYLDSDEKFKNIEMGDSAEFTALESQPSDWATNYSKYYDSSHKAVKGTESTSYTRLTRVPEDWDKNYSNYYTKSGNTYTRVSYVASVEYKPLTEEPADWQSSYASYYKRRVTTTTVLDVDGNIAKDGKFTRTRKSGDGYEAVTLVGGQVPEWKAGKYFTQTNQSEIPKFADGVEKYKMVKTVTAPTFTANSFYSMKKAGSIPSFKVGVYYRLVVDHYANLVEKGLERFNELNKRIKTIKINLDLQGEYDIGDVVGARDETTGIEVWQPITKKIVSIDKRGKNISYKVGDTSK